MRTAEYYLVGLEAKLEMTISIFDFLEFVLLSTYRNTMRHLAWGLMKEVGLEREDGGGGGGALLVNFK